MTDQVVIVRTTRPVTIERNDTQAVVVQTPTPTVTVVEQQGVYHAETCDTRTAEVQAQGPAGPPGETDGATINLPAGETIHGHRVVRVDGGALYHPSVNVTVHADQSVGISTQSGLAPNLVNVRTKGALTEPGWSWSPGLVWCGVDGQLTQAPASTGWLMVVGRVLSSTSIDVDIEPAIHRA